jgi:hypothetical protein
MLDRIALLNTRLGQIPASLQRAPNFPSQLKDFTLFQIKQMLEEEGLQSCNKGSARHGQEAASGARALDGKDDHSEVGKWRILVLRS